MRREQDTALEYLDIGKFRIFRKGNSIFLNMWNLGLPSLLVLETAQRGEQRRGGGDARWSGIIASMCAQACR